MSKEELIRRGLQAQQLAQLGTTNEDTAKPSKEISQYVELFPPGTSNQEIARVIRESRGDKKQIESAISELWEDYRATEDEWAPVQSKKKGGKKKEGPSGREQGDRQSQRGGGFAGRGGGRSQGGRGRSAPPPNGRGAPRPARENGTSFNRGAGRGVSVSPSDRPAPQSQSSDTSGSWAQKAGAVESTTENTDSEPTPAETMGSGWGSTAPASKPAFQSAPPPVNAWAKGRPQINRSPAQSQQSVAASETQAPTSPRRGSPKKSEATGWASSPKKAATPASGWDQPAVSTSTSGWGGQTESQWGASEAAPSAVPATTSESGWGISSPKKTQEVSGWGASTASPKAVAPKAVAPTGWGVASPKVANTEQKTSAWGSAPTPAAAVAPSPKAKPAVEPTGWGSPKKAAVEPTGWGSPKKAAVEPTGWGSPKKVASPVAAKPSTSAWERPIQASKPATDSWGEKTTPATSGWGETSGATTKEDGGWGKAPSAKAEVSQGGWGKQPSPKKAAPATALGGGSAWGAPGSPKKDILQQQKSATPKAIASSSPVAIPSPRQLGAPAVTGSPKGTPKAATKPATPIGSAASPRLRQEIARTQSPKQYLKMGKWDSLASSDVNVPVIEFGNFGLDDNSSSVPAQAPAPTPAAQSSPAWAGAGVGGGWGTSTTALPDKAPSPVVEQAPSSVLSSATARAGPKKTSTAPPGLAPVGLGGVSQQQKIKHVHELDSDSRGKVESQSHGRESKHNGHQGGHRQGQGGYGYPGQQVDLGYHQQYQYGVNVNPDLHGSQFGQPVYPGQHNYGPAESHQKTARNLTATANTDSTTGTLSGSTSSSTSVPTPPHMYQQQYAPPPPPGIAPYNPYSYGYNYQNNYAYYQAPPQGFPSYPNHPRGGMYQNPPRGNMPYVDPSFSNPSGGGFAGAYDPLAQQYGGMPGFGSELGYIPQPPHPPQPNNATKGSTQSSASVGAGAASTTNAADSTANQSSSSFPASSYGSQQGYWASAWGNPVMQPQSQPFMPQHQYHGYSGFDKSGRGGYDKSNKQSKQDI